MCPRRVRAYARLRVSMYMRMYMWVYCIQLIVVCLFVMCLCNLCFGACVCVYLYYYVQTGNSEGNHVSRSLQRTTGTMAAGTATTTIAAEVVTLTSTTRLWSSLSPTTTDVSTTELCTAVVLGTSASWPMEDVVSVLAYFANFQFVVVLAKSFL